MADGVKIANVEWDGGETGKFYENAYVIPAKLVNGKSEIDVKIDTCYSRIAGRIFGVRMLFGLLQ